jgi:hypothetical protein
MTVWLVLGIGSVAYWMALDGNRAAGVSSCA